MAEENFDATNNLVMKFAAIFCFPFFLALVCVLGFYVFEGDFKNVYQRILLGMFTIYPCYLCRWLFPWMKYWNAIVTADKSGLRIKLGPEKEPRFFAWNQIGAVRGSDSAQIYQILDQKGGVILTACDSAYPWNVLKKLVQSHFPEPEVKTYRWLEAGLDENRNFKPWLTVLFVNFLAGFICLLEQKSIVPVLKTLAAMDIGWGLSWISLNPMAKRFFKSMTRSKWRLTQLGYSLYFLLSVPAYLNWLGVEKWIYNAIFLLWFIGLFFWWVRAGQVKCRHCQGSFVNERFWLMFPWDLNRCHACQNPWPPNDEIGS